MMNRYQAPYDRMNGGHVRSPRPGMTAPYRHPPMRDDMPRQSLNRPGSGCGCGLGRTSVGSRTREETMTATPRTCRETPTCGCGQNGGVACRKLLEQIQAVDFALYETVLYLDVYPHSCDALETYRKLRAQSDALRAEYEATWGPLTAFSNQSDTSWDWMSKPFPWEYDAD